MMQFITWSLIAAAVLSLLLCAAIGVYVVASLRNHRQLREQPDERTRP